MADGFELRPRQLGDDTRGQRLQKRGLTRQLRVETGHYASMFFR